MTNEEMYRKPNLTAPTAVIAKGTSFFLDLLRRCKQLLLSSRVTDKFGRFNQSTRTGRSLKNRTNVWSIAGAYEPYADRISCVLRRADRE